MATKPDPMEAQAQAIVEAALNPSITAIEAQRQQAAQEAAQQQQAIAGYSQAAAQIAGGIAPQVQQAYQGASRDVAAFSQGYSQGFQQELNKSQSDINAFLQKMGAPQGQMIQPSTGAADVLYGTTGVIPASSLAREGAAWTAASAQQPATLLGLGSYMQADARRESKKRDQEFLDAIAELEAKRPGAIQDALRELREFGIKERDQRLKEELAISQLGINRSKLKLEGDRVKISAANAATQRMNAQTTRYNAALTKIKNDRNFNINLQQLGINQGNLGLRAQELEAKLKTGGITPTKKQELAALAYDSAEAAFNGGVYVDGEWRVVQKRPVEVLRDLVGRDIPFSIAVKAIQRFARKPGAGPRWKATLGWTRKKGKK